MKVLFRFFQRLLFRWYVYIIDFITPTSLLGDWRNISGFPLIMGRGKIELGENVRVNSGQRFNPIGGSGRTVLYSGTGSKITIGENSGLSNVAIYCSLDITIGKDVKIGGGVKIYDSDFHSLNYFHRRTVESDIPYRKKVIIEDDAFIGAHSIILKGVNIGKGAIVGAGSVVTKSIPPKQIWAGNPARYIKEAH